MAKKLTIAFMTDFDPKKIVDDFRKACEAADVKPWDAIAAGGNCHTNWWRWANGSAAPSMKSMRAAYAGLQKLSAQRTAA